MRFRERLSEGSMGCASILSRFNHRTLRTFILLLQGGGRRGPCSWPGAATRLIMVEDRCIIRLRLLGSKHVNGEYDIFQLDDDYAVHLHEGYILYSVKNIIEHGPCISINVVCKVVLNRGGRREDEDVTLFTSSRGLWAL